MGKKGNGWLSSVKKVFSKQSLNPQDYYSPHPHKEDPNEGPEVVSLEHYFFTSPDLTNGDGDDSAPEDPNHAAISVALVTAAAAAQAAAEVVVRLAAGRQSKADRAATRIQSYYRGYLARRALRALRALVRLQALVRGNTVRKKALMTMRCMQSLVRVQGRIRAQRLQISNIINKEEEEEQPQQPSIIQRKHDLGEEEEEDYNEVEESVGEEEKVSMERSLHLLEERMRKLGRPAEEEKKKEEEAIEEDDDGPRNVISLGKGEASMGNHHYDSDIRRERSLAYAAYARQDQQQNFFTSVANDYRHHDLRPEFLCGNEEPQWRRRSWLEGWRLASSQAAAESPPPRHGSPSPTTISTADDLSEKRVEIDFSGRWLRSEPVKPTRYSNVESSPKSTTHGHRRASVPSFMAPTQSAKAKARAQERIRARDAPSAQWNSSTKSGSAHHPMGLRSPNPETHARHNNLKHFS